jgi:hypothetical protein
MKQTKPENVHGDAVVSTLGDYLVLGPAISSGRWTTAHRDFGIGTRVNCGCFSGTVEEFATVVERTHAGNPPGAGAVSDIRCVHSRTV